MVENSNVCLCPVCSGQFGETLHYLNHEYPNALELQGLEIRVCNNCGLGVAYPERSWTVMEEFYKRSYRATGSAHSGVARSLISQYSVNSRALSQWTLLRTFRSFTPKDLFCDIGPGYIRTEMTKNSYSNKKSGWRVNLALRYEDGAHQMME